MRKERLKLCPVPLVGWVGRWGESMLHNNKNMHKEVESNLYITYYGGSEENNQASLFCHHTIE